MYVFVNACNFVQTYVRMYCDCSSRNDEVPSVTNQLAKDQEVEQLTTNFHVPDDEQPTSSVIDENYARSVVVDDNYYEDEKFPVAYAVVDAKNVRKINILFLYIYM